MKIQTIVAQVLIIGAALSSVACVATAEDTETVATTEAALDANGCPDPGSTVYCTSSLGNFWAETSYSNGTSWVTETASGGSIGYKPTPPKVNGRVRCSEGSASCTATSYCFTSNGVNITCNVREPVQRPGGTSGGRSAIAAGAVDDTAESALRKFSDLEDTRAEVARAPEAKNAFRAREMERGAGDDNAHPFFPKIQFASGITFFRGICC